MSDLQYSEFAAEMLGGNSKQQIGLAEAELNRMEEYLSAAALVIDKNPNERILVALAKRNLQNLPALGEKVRAAVLKERFSYLCLRKFRNCLDNASIYLTADERITFFAIITWIEKTKDGDLNEVLHYSRTPILWKKTACEAGSCLGAECEHFSDCFFQKAKKNAESSNLLFVHHQLFLQDMQMDFAILPHCEKIIFDNAHQLPHRSQKTFGRHLYFYALRNAVKQNIWCKKWEERAAESEKLFLSLNKEIQSYAQNAKKRKIIYTQNLSAEIGVSPEPLQNALRSLLEAIEQTSSEFYSQNEIGKTKDCMQFASDIRKISSDLAFFFTASSNEFVYWVECSSNPHQITFNAEPINISAKWSKSLYPNLKSAFFTSETLSINGHFDYFINRLALYGKNIKSKIFSDGEIDTFVAEFLPKPSEEKFAGELIKTLCEIISKNTANTLIFTDMASISKLQAEIKKDETLQSKTCFFQGIDGNFNNLAGFFQKEAGSVLIGTPDELKSLEDMELPENTLIVIPRLPFPDLKEPVFSKRMEILKEQNKNGFMFVTMPETSIALRMAYSAILRSGKKQTLLLLDSRITSEPYGAKIRSLFPNLKILSHRVFSTGFLK